MEILAKKISKLTLLKIYFIGLFVPLFLCGLINGIIALFGGHAITLNGNTVTGLYGLSVSILLSVILSLWFTLFFWVLSLFGLWVFSWISPIKLKLTEYK